MKERKDSGQEENFFCSEIEEIKLSISSTKIFLKPLENNFFYLK